MSPVILMDTGPLVALFDAKDPDHRWARGEMERLPDHVVTCEPVLAETCFLLARGRIDPVCVLRAVREGTLGNVEASADNSGSLICPLLLVPLMDQGT